MVKSKIITTCIFIVSLIIGIYNYSLAANFPSTVNNNYFENTSKINIIKPNGDKIKERFTGISGNNTPTFYVWKGKSHLDVSSGHYRNFYCMQHRQSVNKNSQNEGKVFARIQFNKDKIIVSKYDVGSNDKFCKQELTYNVKNAYFLSYILTKSEVDVKEQKSGNKNLTQRLIWFKNAELNTFLNDLKSKFNSGLTDTAKKWDLANFSGDGSAGNPSNDAKKVLKKYGNEAMAYQKFSTQYDEFLQKNKDKVNPVINGSTSLSKTKFTSDSAIIGTIKLNYIYGGCNDTNVKFGDILQDKIIVKEKKSGQKISNDKWSICNEKGKDLTIKSGSNFYIKVNKDYIIKNVDADGKFEMEMEIPYKRIYCDADVFLCVNGNGKQLTSVLGRARLGGDNLTYQTSIKINISISAKGQLKIQKKDVNSGEILYGYKVYVQDSKGNYYDINGANKGSTKTEISIKNSDFINISLPNGKYKVTEAEAPSGYDLKQQTKARGAVTSISKTISTLSTVTATLKNWKPGTGGSEKDLEILKIDGDTAEPIEGIKFDVKSSKNDSYFGINETGLITDSQGQIGVSIGHFNIPDSMYYESDITIKEVGSNNLYYADDFRQEKIVTYKHHPQVYNYRYYDWKKTRDDNPNTNTDETQYGWVYGGTSSSNTGVPSNTSLRKYEQTSYTSCYITLSSNKVTFTNKKAYSLGFNKIDSYNNNGLNGAKIVIQYENDDTFITGGYNNGYAEYDGEPEAITINGSLNMSGLKRGTYHIYEVEAPKGYNIELMDNYDESISLGDYEGAVDLGTITINDSNKKPNVNLKNQKYVKIRGKVWEDLKGKDDKYDYIGFDQPYSTDVRLVKGGEVVAETSTEEDGSYEFSELDSGDRILYWELQQYTVEFSYDQEEYITVPVKLNEADGSKVIDQTHEDLDDNNLIGQEGWATTKPNSNILEANYNEDTLYVENINFGVMEKPSTDHSVQESLEYVKLVKDDFEFKYTYNGMPYDENTEINSDAVIDPEDTEYISAVEMQESSRSYTQKLYPSDIKYNMQEGLEDKDRYKVYAVYKIDITNNTTWNEKDRYIEKALYLNELTTFYNDDYYELSDNNWSNSEDRATYAKVDELGGIAPKATKTAYIQFRVKEEALESLINPTLEDMIECVTNVYTNGYHLYDRDDSNWADNTQGRYTHKTVNEQDEDTGLGLKLTLSSTRKVQGSVFEDTKDEEEREDERIGDGIYSEDEKNLTDVVVSLHNVKDNSIAQLYDTLDKVADNKWKVKKKNAVQKVDDNGNYEFVGLVPGRYYLKFTYGNGDVSYKDMEGNDIQHIDTKINGETINSNLYKSTILTGPAKDDTNEYWYIKNIQEDINGTKYNVATDSADVIKNRTKSDNINKELNYATQNADGKIINAVSPSMKIEFEYVDNKEATHAEDVIKNEDNSRLRTNCTGMYFGIIERPYIQVELTKNIKNIKLTLQNGTTIINQDPATQNVSPNITNLDTHGDEDTDINESGYAKIETDSTNLFGSSAEVTYSVKVTNKSEVDYATEEYYRKGEIDSEESVKTIASTIIDYIPKDCLYGDVVSTQGMNANAEVKAEELASLEELYNGGKGYFTPEAYGANNKEDYKKLKITSTKALETWRLENKQISENNSLIYEIKVSKLLNPNQEDLGFTGYTEIIGLKNIPLTPQQKLKQGNYEINNPETHEADDDSATLIITPSTGENRDYTIYIIAVATLIATIGVGISIKKHLR